MKRALASQCILWDVVSLNFLSTDLACMMFDEERSARAILRYGIFAWTKRPTHVLNRTLYEFRGYVFVRYARSREFHVELVIVLNRAWRKELTWKVKTIPQSFAACADLECERRIVSLKITALSSLSCQWAAEEDFMTLSSNNGDVSSDRLFRLAGKSENKRKRYWA